MGQVKLKPSLSRGDITYVVLFVVLGCYFGIFAFALGSSHSWAMWQVAWGVCLYTFLIGFVLRQISQEARRFNRWAGVVLLCCLAAGYLWDPVFGLAFTQSLAVFTVSGLISGICFGRFLKPTPLAVREKVLRVALAWGVFAFVLLGLRFLLGPVAWVSVGMEALLLAGLGLSCARALIAARDGILFDLPIGALCVAVCCAAFTSFAIFEAEGAIAVLWAAALIVTLAQRPWSTFVTAVFLVASLPLFVAVLPSLSFEQLVLSLILFVFFQIVITSLPRTLGHQALPPEDVLASHALVSNSWLMMMNRTNGCVSFPFGAGEQYRAGQTYPLERVFAFSSLATLGTLFSVPTEPASSMRELSVKIDAGPELIDAELRILKRDETHIWFSVQRLDQLIGLAELLEQSQLREAEANQRVDLLLSLASHELRTPISAISMLAEDLRAGRPWAEVAVDFDPQLERLIRLLEDLRFSSSVSENGLSRFTLSDLTRDILDEFSAVALANDLRLHLSLPSEPDLGYLGDRGRIAFALSRVIDNVIKHSHAQNLILMASVVPSAGNRPVITLTLADDGIGIEADRQKHLFEPFSASKDRERNGFGLGLYSARKVLRAIEGDLSVVPAAKGCCFSLSIPVHSIEKANLYSVDKPVSAAAAILSEAAVVTASPTTKGQVLLIEDNRLVGEITVTRLARLFDKVDWAESGDSGLEKALSGQYDMIFVDQLLPIKNGDEIVREVRKTHPLLPIIGVTASTLGDECLALQEAGANLAVEKPLSYAVMCDLVAEFCSDLSLKGT